MSEQKSEPRVEHLIRDMRFPCGYCNLPFKDHNMALMTKCFQELSKAKQELKEIYACDKCDLCEDHHD